MFDPNALAAVRIRPARDVAHREDAMSARIQKFVDNDAPLEDEAGRFCEFKARTHADAADDKVGIQRAAASQSDLALVYAGGDILEMEDHPVLFMQAPHEIADLRTENALHRPLLRRDHMDVETAHAKGRRNFESDEARAEHNGPPRGRKALNDRPTVGQRPQSADMRQVGAGYGKADGFGPRREQ